MTEAQAKQFLAAVKVAKPEDLTFADWKDLHGLLDDMIHFDDVERLKSALELHGETAA